jgi:hypothetical protein
MNCQKLQERLKTRFEEHQESLEQSESPEHHRSVCIAILDEVNDFICSWEEHGIPSELPCELVHRALSTVVAKLGPGNIKLREYFWTLLQSKIETVQCRQAILDFLPATLPVECDKEVKDDLLKTLQSIFEEDYDALEQVLRCLARLAQSERIPQSEIFLFALGIMKTVPERCLHLVFVSLVEHIGNDREAIMAVDAFRQEVKLLDDAQSTEAEPFVISVAKGISSVLHTRNGPRFFQAYLSAIDDDLSSSEDASSLFSLQDSIVLILSLEKEEYCDQVERIFDIILMRNGLKRRIWNRLIKLCTEETGELHTTFLDSMLSLPILLLLAPVRNRNLIHNETAIATTRYVASKLAADLNGKDQQNLISSLFCLVEEFELDNGTGEAGSLCVDEHQDSGSTDHGKAILIGRQMVRSSVFEILATISKNKAPALKPFKDRFIDRLISTDRSCLNDSNLINTLCSIVAFLDDIDPSTGRLPYSIETLRSLLYSSPTLQLQRKDNADDRSVCGMLLASSVVSAGRLRPKDILALWRLTQPFLTTSNSRLLSPPLKMHCVRFLAIMHEWVQNNSAETTSSKTRKEIFEIVTRMISASRVVKYVSSFSEWKRKGAALQYTKRPAIFAGHQSKRPGRKMYFSFEYFIRNRSSIRPSSWSASADRIFQLTTTYLSIGRDIASSKWLPNPWVEAAIEFPSLEISQFQSLSSRRRRALDFFNTVMGDVELSSCSSRSDGSEKEFFDILRTLDMVVLDQILQYLLGFSLSLVLGLSISAAVLQNTYDHFEKRIPSTDRSVNLSDDAVRLLQFQLFKIYDMVEGCRFAERVFRSIGRAHRSLMPGTRKRKRNTKPEDNSKDVSVPFSCDMLLHAFLGRDSPFDAKTLKRDIDEGLEQIQRFVSQLLQTTRLIQPETLWACLVERGHDALIIQATLDLPKELTESCDAVLETQLLQIVDCRLNIIDHITSGTRPGMADISSLMTGGTSSLAMTRPKFARCLRLCAHLSLSLSHYRNKHNLSGSNKVRSRVYYSLRLLSYWTTI